MIQITYEGVDITGDVFIQRCYHDMYAAGQADTLHLKVNDAKRLWDAWGPAAGDKIRVDYGSISTGAMFVTSARPRNGTFDIVAQSAPKSGFEKQNKAWQQVWLLQIGAEIAQRNGLSFASYGVEDRLYPYRMQTAEGDFRFLSRIAQLEGCAILIYDQTLVMYSEPYMEAQEPSEMLNIGEDGDFDFCDRRADWYGSCILESGIYSGRFDVENGSARIYRPDQTPNITSDDEAQRFSKNLLRAINKSCYGGFIRSHILPGYAAASTISLSVSRAPSWNGTVFLDHIRNDYGRGQSKIFFRKPLEGY